VLLGAEKVLKQVQDKGSAKKSLPKLGRLRVQFNTSKKTAQ
jgi:hypothetical protein